MSRQPGDMRPGRPDRSQNPNTPDRDWRWVAIVLGALIVIAFLLQGPFSSSSIKSQTYGDFIGALNGNHIVSATVNNDSGKVTYTDDQGQKFSVTGPHPLTDSTVSLL